MLRVLDEFINHSFDEICSRLCSNTEEILCVYKWDCGGWAFGAPVQVEIVVLKLSAFFLENSKLERGMIATGKHCDY